MVVVDTIILGGDYRDVLFIVHEEELWLLGKWNLKIAYISQSLSFKVEFHNLLLFSEYQSIIIILSI